jgi:hypothetical protein
MYEIGNYLNVAVAIMAYFDEVVASCCYSSVYIGHPLNVCVQVISCYLIFGTIRAINVRVQEHVVN